MSNILNRMQKEQKVVGIWENVSGTLATRDNPHIVKALYIYLSLQESSLKRFAGINNCSSFCHFEFGNQFALIITDGCYRFGSKTGARNGGNRRKWVRKDIPTAHTVEPAVLVELEERLECQPCIITTIRIN